MSDAVAASARGVTVRLHIFDSADRELRDALHPPWPDWMGELYRLEESTNARLHVASGAITASAAVSAVAAVLRQRIELLAFLCGGLEELGWDLHLDGDELVAGTALTVGEARAQLDSAGLLGSMCRVADIDADGWPVMTQGAHQES